MTTPGRRQVRRQLVTAAIATAAVPSGTRRVAAHGAGATGGRGFDLLFVLTVVTGLGLTAGVVTAFRGSGSVTRTGSRQVGRAIGPLLVCLGVLAVAPVVLERPVTGAVGVTVGIVTGAVAARGGCGRCGDATVGAVAVHRFVEGVTLAAIVRSGAAVGALGVFVVSAHTVAECVAIGGQPAHGRWRASGAVLAVSVVFVAGVALGSAGFLEVGPNQARWSGAVVGGLLFALGLAETDFVATSNWPGTLRSVRGE